MTEIIPAILAHDAEEFERKLRRVEGLVDMVQVDCMDGLFVPNVTFYDGKTAQSFETELGFDLHLMVNNPLAVLDEWKYVANIERATFHIETTDDPKFVITEIERHGIEPSVALNPETPLSRVVEILPLVESILVMGVNPGASGREMVPGTTLRIAEIRKLEPDLPIAIDGGVTKENAAALIAAGATRLIAASAIFKSNDVKSAIRELQNLSRSYV